MEAVHFTAIFLQRQSNVLSWSSPPLHPFLPAIISEQFVSHYEVQTDHREERRSNCRYISCDGLAGSLHFSQTEIGFQRRGELHSGLVGGDGPVCRVLVDVPVEDRRGEGEGGHTEGLHGVADLVGGGQAKDPGGQLWQV